MFLTKKAQKSSKDDMVTRTRETEIGAMSGRVGMYVMAVLMLETLIFDSDVTRLQRVV